MRIGELAAVSGVTRDALRYYERRGLLPHAPRTRGGFRQYDARALERLHFVKAAQAHGLTLAEIHDLVSHRADAGGARCRHVRDLLARKIMQLDERRRQLDAFCRTLREFHAMCDRSLRSRSEVDCPVVENLTRGRRR